MAEVLLDQLRRRQRVISRTTDPYDLRSQPATRAGIVQQVSGQQRVQIENHVAADATLTGLIHQQFDGRLVIQDHLRFLRVPALGALAPLQQQLRFEQVVGITLQAAGIPGQIDEQAVIDLPCMGARRALLVGRLPHGCKFKAQLPRQVKGSVRPILRQKFLVVPNRLAALDRLTDRLFECFSLRGKWDIDFGQPRRHAQRARHTRHANDSIRGELIPPRPRLPNGQQLVIFHQPGQTVLQCATRHRLCQGGLQFLNGYPFRITPDYPENIVQFCFRNSLRHFRPLLRDLV